MLVGPQSEQPWQINLVTNPKLALQTWINEEIIKVLKRWSEVFPKEDTFASRLGVPSMLVRVDFTLVGSFKEGTFKIGIYEIEDSPFGLGFLKESLPEVESKINNELPWIKDVVAIWPKERKKGGDDPLLWRTIYIHELNKLNKEAIRLVAPRINNLPEELINKSIWPVNYREEKEYMVRLGFAEAIDKSNVDLDKLCNERARQFEGIVFKSDGARGEKVLIWPTKSLTKKVYNWLGKSNFGVCKLNTIKEEIKNWKRVYIQPFLWPIPLQLNCKPYFGIFRIFYAYDTDTKEWVCLGGIFNLRPSLKIHGATDAVFMLVLPPSSTYLPGLFTILPC
jgi:hypothetical protein